MTRAQRAQQLNQPLSNVEAQSLMQKRVSGLGSGEIKESFSIHGDGMHTEEPRREECSWKDVDAAHTDDPQMCTTYVNEIYDYLREAECKHRP